MFSLCLQRICAADYHTLQNTICCKLECKSDLLNGRRVQVIALVDAAQVTEVLQSDEFKQVLKPLRYAKDSLGRACRKQAPQGVMQLFKYRSLRQHRSSANSELITWSMPGYRLTGQQDSLSACVGCRAECEPANDDAGLRVTIVSKAFEGKTAKRREKLVLQVIVHPWPWQRHDFQAHEAHAGVFSL